MIKIERPEDCCGCSACVERCPKQCISFDEDKEGFRYPVVDASRCIECGLCEKVCPVINGREPVEIKNVFAARIHDENIRKTSSSGGVFTAIATDIIEQGGVVFGARFDENWEVCHSYVENVGDLAQLRGSKYMQSRMGDSYLKAERFLKEGRTVMFCGTPCQIAGLRRFLRRDYENLVMLDIICHGVPSPKVWRKYLAQMVKEKKIGPSLSGVGKVDFRAKEHGWLNYDICIDSNDGQIVDAHNDNPYLKAFNMNVLLRPICFQCPFKDGKSGSDLTLADFWGIAKVDPSMHDDKGTSMIIDYGKFRREIAGVEMKEEPVSSVERYNGSYGHASQYNGNRVVMFGKLDSTDDVTGLMARCTNPTRFQRVLNVIYRKTHR